MSILIQIYQGGDLVISKNHLESLGIRPGDNIILQSERPKTFISLAEKAKRVAILNRFAEAWEADELDDFEQQQTSLWQTWETFNS